MASQLILSDKGLKLTQKKRLVFERQQQMKRRFKKLRIPLATLVIGLSAGVVHAGLVGHWTFDEDSGNIAFDSSGNGFNIKLTNAVREKGVFGGAVSFQGMSGAGAGIFRYSDNTITVCAWVRHNAFRIDEIERYVTVAPEVAVIRKEANEALHFYLKINGNLQHLQVEYALTANRWHHVAGTWDGLTQRLYLDGVEIASQELSGILDNASNVTISSEGDESFNGMLDDVRIYNQAIDEDEIKHLYNLSRASFIPKGYVAKLVEETESIVKELKPEEAVVFIERKISDYEQWRTKNSSHLKSYDKELPSDIYVLLARAKEAAGAPIQDVIAAYKRSVLHPNKPSNYVPESLLWLFEKTHKDEYIDVVKEFVRNSDNPSHNIYQATKHFELSGNWAAFKLFLDAMFSEMNDTTFYAGAVANGLEEEDGVWADKFVEYCRNKPELTGYIFREREKSAGNYLIRKDFGKALEIYRDIVSRCGPNQNKAPYEFKVYECLFNDGRYNSVIQDIDNFIKNNKTTHKLLISKAIILKGQAYVQLGDINQAIETFFTLMIEYSEVKEAPEAHFFVGYCYMLQSKFSEAAEAFNLVVKDYPNSEYTSNARLCLDRIKNMTE
jgi:tetratricopeptide (TPR) repeat protein